MSEDALDSFAAARAEQHRARRRRTQERLLDAGVEADSLALMPDPGSSYRSRDSSEGSEDMTSSPESEEETRRQKRKRSATPPPPSKPDGQSFTSDWIPAVELINLVACLCNRPCASLEQSGGFHARHDSNQSTIDHQSVSAGFDGAANADRGSQIAAGLQANTWRTCARSCSRLRRRRAVSRAPSRRLWPRMSQQL